MRSLLAKGLRLAFSVSATSRAKRSLEVDGQDYFFITPEEFRNGVSMLMNSWNGRKCIPVVTTARLRSEIDRIWAQGNSAIFDVDVVGGLHLKEVFGDRRRLALFVSPPSVEVLEERLRARGTESPESLRSTRGQSRT